MVRIEKVTINIGVGNSKEKLEKAKVLLERLTNQKPVETITNKRVPTWNIRPGSVIGLKVTLRGQKAEELLKRCFAVVENKIQRKSINEFGNFSFGVAEYIDVPGMKYDPEIGLFGFDVCVTISKEGYRTKNRKISSKKIPKSARVTREETIRFLKEKYGVEVE